MIYIHVWYLEYFDYFFVKNDAIFRDPFAALASAFDLAVTWTFSCINKIESIFQKFQQNLAQFTLIVLFGDWSLL